MEPKATREIVLTVTVHKYEREKVDKPKRRTSLRKQLARLNGWTVALYAFLTAAGILLYKAGAAYALRERGYHAIGGEALALLLPVLYYVMSRTIGDMIEDMAKRRARK